MQCKKRLESAFERNTSFLSFYQADTSKGWILISIPIETMLEL